MKKSNRLAITVLAAAAMAGSTTPALARLAPVTGAPAANAAGTDSANLQRGARAGARGGARPAGGQARARPAGGGQAATRPTRQAGTPHNVRSTSGTNLNSAANRNVNRNTDRSVNRNTNINRDVNVDVDNHWGNDWNDRYWHPVAAGVAMGVTAAVVGSMVNQVPSTGCVTTIVNGMSYYQCGSTWYQPSYAGTAVQYIVVNPPH